MPVRETSEQLAVAIGGAGDGEGQRRTGHPGLLRGGSIPS
jgi:hypothetical protein